VTGFEQLFQNIRVLSENSGKMWSKKVRIAIQIAIRTFEIPSNVLAP